MHQRECTVTWFTDRDQLAQAAEKFPPPRGETPTKRPEYSSVIRQRLRQYSCDFRCPCTVSQSYRLLGHQPQLRIHIIEEARCRHPVCGRNPDRLAHTSSGLNPKYKQLKFLRDAVLPLTASELITSAYPEMPVGEQSSLRAQLMSDHWLALLGSRIEIERWWRIRPKASGDSKGQTPSSQVATNHS